MNSKTILSIKEVVVIEARSLQNSKGRLAAGKFLRRGRVEREYAGFHHHFKEFSQKFWF